MQSKDTGDIVGGLGLAAIGLFAAIYGQRYEFGDLNRMGPGYFPVVLGGLLCVLGFAIALPAFFRRGEPIKIAWKTYALVMASIAVFAFALKPLGIVFATAIAVLLASMADNGSTWKGRLLTAVGIAIVTWLVFKLGLGMVLPTWPWSP
ncbi:MAG: tripartite tricarboxylate transporter TctB family protein [Hydrogenophaga sp.]